MKKVKVFLFPNGNAAVTGEDGQQIKELQESWLLMFAQFLQINDVDIENSEFNMPNGQTAKIFALDDGSYYYLI